MQLANHGFGGAVAARKAGNSLGDESRVSQTRAMWNAQKALRVARFELAEARYSKGMALLALLYGGGAAVGSSIFLSVLRTTEQTAKDALAEQMQMDVSQLPEDMVREQAMPWLLGFVSDEDTRSQLLEMDPLSIFFGFATLQSVAMLVLLASTGSIAKDVQSGAARFILFRCDRLSWALGKGLGQATLLGAGLLLASLASGATGMFIDEAFDLDRLFWLLRTAFRAWIYGLSYLGLFIGISMIAGTPTIARAGAVLSWFGVGLGHSLVTADWLNQTLPLRRLSFLFPPEHQDGLWSGSLATYIGSVAALLLFGALTFGAGFYVFERKDA